MARLNIETGLWSDGRFQDLLIKVGDRFRATGMIVNLWTLAQQYWCPDKKPIPEEAWKASAIPDEVIQCGLAERRDQGVYAKGSEEHFAWWFERQAAGKKGGLASAEARRSKGKQSSSVAQAEPSKLKQIEPSSSFSSSKRKKSIVDPSDTTLLWNYYSEKLKAKGLEAIHSGAKTNALCKRLLNNHGLDKAKALVDAYLVDKSLFVKDAAWSINILASQEQKYLAKAAPQHPSNSMSAGDLERLEAEFNGETTHA